MNDYIRERADAHLVRDDSSAAADFDLLASMLRIRSDHAANVIHHFGGSLRATLSAPIRELEKAPHIGRARAIQIKAAGALMQRHYRETFELSEGLHSPDATRQFLRAELRDEPHEVFCAIFLDTRHNVQCFERLFRGTIDAAHVHPRVVVERALANRAAALIVAHNHPSGVAEPSQADLAITRRLRDALGLVDIRLLDHFIVGDADVVSLAERGLV